jgi:alkylhydroperoxidase/carboxymuconolactone decarboxylase family protein YurZ
VEEVLLQGATEAELAETLDIALYMGGSLSLKMVRYAMQIREELGRAAKPTPGKRK